jgi:hypothetical protein
MEVPVKVAEVSVPETTELGVRVKVRGAEEFSRVGAAESWMVPGWPTTSLKVTAGEGIAETVVPGGIPTPWTDAPSKPVVTCRSVTVVVAGLIFPVWEIVGKASVPVVPEKEAMVVPAGTSALLMEFPGASPAPLTTEKALDPLVAVRAVTELA